MSYLLLSINHVNADATLRSKIALVAAEIPRLTTQILHDYADCRELIILSTCNRTEIYIWHQADASTLSKQIICYLAKYKNISKKILLNHIWQLQDTDAITHLVKTASGFMSMMVGETQIFGQLKSCYANALAQGSSGKNLNVLFQKVFYYAKQTRTKSGIGQDTVSLASAIAKICFRIFSASKELNIVFVGAGEMVELVANYLHGKNNNKFHFCNRTLSKAQTLACKFSGDASGLKDLSKLLLTADVVVVATASPNFIVDKKTITKIAAQRGYKLQLFLDLSMPANIDGSIDDLDNIYYYSVDAIAKVVEDNLEARKQIATNHDALMLTMAIKIADSLPNSTKQQMLYSCRKSLQSILKHKAEQQYDTNCDKNYITKNQWVQINQKINAPILHQIMLLLRQNQDIEQLIKYANSISNVPL